MEAEGESGELRVGWRVAAVFGPWKLKPAADGHVVRPQWLSRDPFWITQAPLQLRLDIGGLTWTWENVQLIEGGRIRVHSAPEEGVRDLADQSIRQS